MSRNEIRLDQIQSRLGKQNRRNTQYDDDGYAVPYSKGDDQYDNDRGGSTLNAGFLATMAAVSLAAGMGTFYFVGGDMSVPDVGLKWGWSTVQTASATSVLDPVCGKGWEANLPNVDQMHCYLTKQPYRLCDRGEYDALLATIKRYDEDYDVWHRKYMMATFKTIGKAQTQSMQLGMEAAKLTNMQGSDDKKIDQMLKVTGIADNIMKPANDVLAERKGKIPQYKLEEAAFALAKQGYFDTSDFGYTAPVFIKNALQRAGKVKPACPNRG